MLTLVVIVGGVLAAFGLLIAVVVGQSGRAAKAAAERDVYREDRSKRRRADEELAKPSDPETLVDRMCARSRRLRKPRRLRG